MSPIGRACTAGAVVLAVVTVAFWDTGSPPASGARAVEGAELFRAKGCASCHDGPDSRAGIGGYPSLVDAADWAGRRRPETSAGAYLAESITEPNAFISPALTGSGPTTIMPNLTLTPDEVDALVDYLLSE